MDRHELTLVERFDVPLRELSALCTYEPQRGEAVRGEQESSEGQAGTVLVAMGDATSEVAWTTIATSPGGLTLGSWEVLDLADLAGLPDGALDRDRSQCEALAADPAGVVVVVLEEPARAVVVDGRARRLLAIISLEVPDRFGAVAASWGRDDGSRGEGVALMEGGHLLVVKEKRPAALLEVGLRGDAPLGLGHLLGPRRAWQPPTPPDPSRPVTFEALAVWPLDPALDGHLDDLSDAAVSFDGRLHLLSDQSSTLARVAALPGPTGEAVTADALLRLPGRPDKAEGLALLPGGEVLVGLDTRKPKHNLLLLAARR